MLCQVSKGAWLMVPALTKLTELGALSHMDKKLARKLAKSIASSESSPMMRYPHNSVTQSGSDGAFALLCFRQAHVLLTYSHIVYVVYCSHHSMTIDIIVIAITSFSRSLAPIDIWII